MDWREWISENASDTYDGIMSVKARAGIAEYDSFLKHQRQGFGWAWSVYEENPPMPEDTPQAYLDRITALIGGGYHPARIEDFEQLLNTPDKELLERFAELVLKALPAEDDLGGIKSGIDMFLRIVNRAATG